MARANEPAIVAPRRFWPIVLASIVALALLIAWFARERIADTVIARQLERFDVPATYRIESIGPTSQVLRDVVVGDPANPDLTIERLEIGLVPRFGAPAINAVTLVRPRLYGRWLGGRLSFGRLDKALFEGPHGQPFRLPDIELTIVDGRALVESEFGPVGVKLEGRGALRGSFAGEIAAVAPQLDIGGCHAERTTLYGAIKIAGEKPRFTGPLRLRGLECAEPRLGLADASLQLDASFAPALDGVEGKAGLETGALAFDDQRLLASHGTVRFTWRNRSLNAHYDLSGRGFASWGAAAVALNTTGVLRGSLNRIELEGEFKGSGISLGPGIDSSLAQLARAGAGTLVASLLDRIRPALFREGQGSALAVSYVLRQGGASTSLVIPQAAVRGGSGATLLAVSRLQFIADGGGPPRLAGNFVTGGANLPQIAGRLERQTDGSLITRMTMAEYTAGDARAVLPSLTVVQLPDGSLGFSGEARLSGALPGGRAENLQLPLDGSWSKQRGLAVWRSCTTLRFDRLALANLSLDHRALAFCPAMGGPILAVDARGLRIAAGAPSLDLGGQLSATPIRIRSGPVGIAWPGALTARALDVSLGPPATASRFRLANLTARTGEALAGRFAGADVQLSAVPLDILDAAGAWRYARGKLALSEIAFRLEDRQADDRFQPLIGRDAALELADNLITSAAIIREPKSDREVVHTTIRHNLGNGHGHADLSATGVVFDQQLQPDGLTLLARGLVANASGTVRGSGRIDWTPERVTSSGRFSTDGLDFAAAFGPVKGAAGTLVLTDLLGLVSAPDQQLRIASINPGIEANDGVMLYELRPDAVLAVKGAAWPFLGGTLTLLPVTMRMGTSEARRYTLMIEGMNAARLIERMELANFSATGVFDGTLPMVFDEDGGHIDGGQLRARAPGGNISYVGALSYKDLSTMANFAFDALKALDYRDMTITMEGPLAGEIITRVQFAGIRQGAAAKRNFLTERIARLPILFNVNLRARFFQLVSSFRSLYDPAYVRDPRTLGLLDDKGRPIAPAPYAEPSLQNGANDIQRRESRKLP